MIAFRDLETNVQLATNYRHKNNQRKEWRYCQTGTRSGLHRHYVFLFVYSATGLGISRSFLWT